MPPSPAPASSSALLGPAPVPGRQTSTGRKAPTETAPVVERLRFRTDDEAEGIGVLDEVYAVRGVRRTPEGGFSLAVPSAGTGPVTYERLHLGVSFSSGITEDSGVVRVAHVVGGVLAATSAGDRFPRTGPFLFP